MSSDGNILAATGGNTTTNKSFVRVFQNISGVWIQLGSDINDINSEDWFGRSISMSSDGKRIAIGIPLRDINGIDSGAVEVYENISGTWTQIGSDILGQSDIENLGQSVSLSSDGNVLAIGVPEHNEFSNGTKTGRVEIYENISGNWIQIGSDIMGENAGDWFGDNVSLSSDGNSVAIGSSRNSESLTTFATGQVEIYANISGVWTQIGSDLNGLENDRIGESISLSSDGNIVAFGAIDNVRGFARVYENIGGVWTQTGSDILGENVGDLFGSTISLSSDGNIVAIGSALNSDSGFQAGHVRVFQNIGGVWTQTGIDIDGEAANNLSAEKNNLSLSSDGTTVAIGAWQNNGGGLGNGSGHVRVYNLSSVLSLDSFEVDYFTIYPNPIQENVQINLNSGIEFKQINIYTALGKYLYSGKSLEINISNLSSGMYILEVETNLGRSSKKIIKE